MNFEHRLSRTLGYDGIRAAKKAQVRAREGREESPAHEAKESAAVERDEHSGGGGDAFAKKALARALGHDGNWIAGATKNKGGLHRSLGVPEGQKIPKGKIAAAASKGGKVGKQARLAETLSGLGSDGTKCLGTDGTGKMEKTMHEFKHGELHSGSKTGPMVTNRKQAIAIGMNQARKAGE